MTTKTIYQKVEALEKYCEEVKLWREELGYENPTKHIYSMLKILLDDIMNSPVEELSEFKKSGLREFTEYLRVFFKYYGIKSFVDVIFHPIINKTMMRITLFTYWGHESDNEFILEFLISALMDDTTRYDINCDMMPQCTEAFYLERSIIKYFLNKSGMSVTTSQLQ